jgi:ABC-type bacteriocin/lantibiotic exporter with double-glycine peptidase domain
MPRPCFIEEAYRHVWHGTKKRPVTLAGVAVYPQLNKWSCGPMSLRYCLAKWGHDVDPRQIARMANTSRKGTDEVHLELAAFFLGSRLDRQVVHTAREAKEAADRALKKGKGLILCVNAWQHWVAVVHRSRRGYLVFDPKQQGPVIQLWGWKKLARRLRYRDKHLVVRYFIASVSRPVQRS